MKTTFAIETSRELSSFSFYKDALYAFESVLSKGLLRFNSDLVGEICIGLICLSPMFGQFFQARRPKYYEDKTLKFRGSVTPEVRMYKGKLKKFEKEKLLQAVKDIFIENSIISENDAI